MARKSARKERTLTILQSILGIDSSYDAATKSAFLYREKRVYAYFTNKGYSVTQCQGPLAKRIHTAPLAQQHGVVYLTGVGHGSPTTFTGHIFATADQDVFFECDSEIDCAFADGLTAAQVYDRVQALFRQRVADFRAQGKQTEAAMLESALDCLRCPSSPPGPNTWGDPNARLI